MTRTAKARPNRTGSLYGTRAVITSLHAKAHAVVPAFAEHAGIVVEAYEGFDTDSLGTFTGEVARPGDMRETAVLKARRGIADTGMRFGIASEGSYGPHPVYAFLPGGLELMVFVDGESDLVVCETLVEDRPCFASETVRTRAELETFAGRIGFPAHGLILAPAKGAYPPDAIEKGLDTPEALVAALPRVMARSDDLSARVTTDMRAHRNPTRMATIGRLAERLARRVATPCPECGAPGFGRVRSEPGLPCELCGAPTRQTAVHIDACAACDYELTRKVSDPHADPAGCDFCNP